MRFSKTAAIVALMVLTTPVSALAADAGSSVSPTLSTGAGVLTLLFAVALLLEMLSLRHLAGGSALAENITFAVLATVCLAASVLVSWLGRFVSSSFSVDQARLGADLLGVVAIAFFGIFFCRVRRAMSLFLSRLTGQEDDLIAAMDEDARQEPTDA
ncbi:MAG: hypothetical protein Q7J82_10645 [Coriobacteriia bacterium]|nr:hypothetical protein [Coriobacteriia bacterium]